MNPETQDSRRLLLFLSEKINLKKSVNMLFHQILASTIHINAKDKFIWFCCYYIHAEGYIWIWNTGTAATPNDRGKKKWYLKTVVHLLIP